MILKNVVSNSSANRSDIPALSYNPEVITNENMFSPHIEDDDVDGGGGEGVSEVVATVPVG